MIRMGTNIDNWTRDDQIAHRVRAFVRGKNHFKLYLNGQQLTPFLKDGGGNIQSTDDIDVDTVTTNLPGGTLRLGRRTDGQSLDGFNTQFFGLVDDVAFFDQALKTEEISSLFNSANLSGSETGLARAATFDNPGQKTLKTIRHKRTFLVSVSANRDNAADAKALDLPKPQVTMHLPFKEGEVWLVGQQHDAQGGSHNGPWPHCFDLTRQDGQTNGAPVHACAPGRVTHVIENNPSDPNGDGNVVVVRQAGQEFASYLHILQNSFSEALPWNKAAPQSLPEAQQPTVVDGKWIAKTGDTGAGKDNLHMHFVLLDQSDPADFATRITIPIAFSDYSFSDDQGVTWRELWRLPFDAPPSEG